MDEVAVKIENLKKKYQLGVIGGTTLNAELQSWWARKRGKEDPNRKISVNQGETGETFWALNGINLEINKGEALGIIGANGAGKSTLLKILSRITAPTEGEVKLRGRVSSMLEVGTGFHGELTGRENIYMNGAILGMSKKEVSSKIEDIIDFSECRQFIDTPVKRYSSGMYVKLAFAVAAHLDAEIMVMDEVLAVGDMKFQKKCLGKMSDSAQHEGKTVLYVSHNMHTIRQLCTRCIVLNHGELAFDGGVEPAIQMYMNREKGNMVSRYDFTDSKRPPYGHGTILFLKSFEFVGKEYPIYEQNEKIQFAISWTSKENIKDLRVYFTVKSSEDDSIAGMTQSEIIGDAVAGTESGCCLEFDASNLVEGEYWFYLDVHVMNEYGTHYSYDQPIEKIRFEIVKDKAVISMNWQRKYWGNVMLNKVRLVK